MAAGCLTQPEQQQQLLGERDRRDLCKVTCPESPKQGEAAQIRAGRLAGGRARQRASGMQKKIFLRALTEPLLILLQPRRA